MRLSKKDVENAGDLSIGRLLGFKWIVYSVFRVNQYQISIRIFAERIFLIEDGALKPSILKPWHSVVQSIDKNVFIFMNVKILQGNSTFLLSRGYIRCFCLHGQATSWEWAFSTIWPKERVKEMISWSEMQV